MADVRKMVVRVLPRPMRIAQSHKTANDAGRASLQKRVVNALWRHRVIRRVDNMGTVAEEAIDVSQRVVVTADGVSSVNKPAHVQHLRSRMQRWVTLLEYALSPAIATVCEVLHAKSTVSVRRRVKTLMVWWNCTVANAQSNLKKGECLSGVG